MGLFEGQLVAMIHSGSRGLGHQVCSEHSRLLERKLKKTQTDGRMKIGDMRFQTDNLLAHQFIPRRDKIT